ncbi:hypothetical protein GCM10027431_26420 [Lysobacter rhizosphaerae]
MAAITESKLSCCVESLRNRFFLRKQMLADDFRIEQSHLIARRRQVNREVLGTGVVRGYRVTAATATGATGPVPAALRVTSGFALDRSGREAVLCDGTELSAANTFLLVESNNVWCPRDIDASLAPGRYILAVHYAERGAGETVPSSPCGCGDPERTHLCETVLFSLRPIHGECECGEAKHAKTHGCVKDACKGGRGPHARLVTWSMRHRDRATALRSWSGYDVAVDDAIALACVEIAGPPDECQPIKATLIDDASPRRIVKTNDVLFDLLNGRDLTRISYISWPSWHRSDTLVKWGEFSDFFNATPLDEKSVLTKFTVRFSGPVRAETVRTDVITITIHMRDAGTGWVRSRRIPLTVLDLTPTRTDLPAGTTDQLQVAVSRRWARDEIEKGGESQLSERDFVVEIEVRGDLIIDCSGQSVDANAVGLQAPSDAEQAKVTSGNGTPGGTFLSSFKVEHSSDTDTTD